MKKLITGITLLISLICFAQNNESELNPVLTGAPFLRISPDARAGGLGDQAVATSPDAFSQYWNAAKYPFSRSYSGIGLSYTPYLNELTNDIFLLYGAFHTYLNDSERSTLGISIYYFNLGEVTLTSLGANDQIQVDGIAKPNEFSIDASYGLKLSDNYAMAVTGRFIRSDLFNGINDNTVQAANSMAVDIAGYYESPRHQSFGDFDGQLHAGFQLSNLGPKLDYSNSEENQAYLPTNLRLGVNYSLIVDDYNRVNFGVEGSKLLVPTPQADGTIPNESPVGAIFSSFGDAPGGGEEELKEIIYSANAEYVYNDAFAFRMGYFHESPIKGDRQYLTLGAGLKFSDFGIDFSYLIPTSETNNALENTLRFALTWDFGGEAYNTNDY